MADLLYYFVAWLSLFLSALSGLGFLVIRLMPMQLPFSIYYAFLRLRRKVLGAALVSGVAVFTFAGLPTEG